VASQLLIDAAATPPFQGGEYALFQFIHTSIDRPRHSSELEVQPLWKMKTLRSKFLVISIVTGSGLIPLYANHGNQFLSRAMEMSAAEVRVGSMAIDKSSNTDIQAFAEMLVTDYNEALQKLMELRAARTTVRATPAATSVSAQSMWGVGRMHRTASDIPITPDHQRTADRLSSLSGNQFDQRFISEIIREQREAISLFEAQRHGNASLKTAPHDVRAYSLEELAKDLDTADFARATLPALRRHLERAEALQRQLQKR
jgi:predicted outer membrane protein